MLLGETGQPACFSVFMAFCSLVLSGGQKSAAKVLCSFVKLTTQLGIQFLTSRQLSLQSAQFHEEMAF